MERKGNTSREVKRVTETKKPDISKEQTTPSIKHEDVDLRIWYIKLGGGSARIRVSGTPRIIKPNEKFQALPSEIPASFKDIIVPVNREKEAEVIKTLKSRQTAPKKVVYSVQKHEGTELFDVVNSTGKIINGEPLEEEDATKLKNDLES